MTDANEQAPTAESRYADELAFLSLLDAGPRPPGWLLTPSAVVQFIAGSEGDALSLPRGTKPPEGMKRKRVIPAKFVRRPRARRALRRHAGRAAGPLDGGRARDGQVDALRAPCGRDLGFERTRPFKAPQGRSRTTCATAGTTRS